MLTFVLPNRFGPAVVWHNAELIIRHKVTAIENADSVGVVRLMQFVSIIFESAF